MILRYQLASPSSRQDFGGIQSPLVEPHRKSVHAEMAETLYRGEAAPRSS